MTRLIGFGSLLLLLVVALPLRAETTTYTCPMHPHYLSEEPGKCPICGMDLVLVDVAGEEGHAHHHAPGGRQVVTLTSEMVQKTGVRTETVQPIIFGKDVRGYGTIAANERLQRKVYSRVTGWIRTLNVSAVGDSVKEGDLLYTIHSPDLVLAQYDLLSFDRSGRNIAFSKLFTHYAVDEGFVKELRRTKKVKQDVPYYSGHSGVVAMLNVREGSHVTVDSPLMVIEDYTSVWVMVELAEQDLAFLSVGDKALIESPFNPAMRRQVTVDYIYPTIDEKTRTGKVRLVVDNPDEVLKPGAYVDVTFEANPELRLAVPSESILRDRTGEYVMRALGDGRFSPQRVETGIHRQGKTEILRGLNEGDAVVVNGQFLIDSETSLREALASHKAGGEHAGH